jgi:DNA-binding response OmpR family regulator
VNLEFEGHEVEVATDGRYALQAMVEDGPFDVVVLDLMMPWSDGFDFLHNIGRKHGGARVVVLTARDDGYTKARAADAGVDAYITKPYDPDVLAQKVSQLARVDKR